MNIKETLRSILSLQDYIDVEAADQNIRSNIPFRGPNVYILGIAIIIASVGLNVNSIPVIIGAMLISPLMSPIIGLGLGLGINDKQLLISALKNLGIMVGISLLVSTMYFILTPLEVDNPTELMARTKPSIYDVMIALFGGLAGVLEISRKEKGTVMSGVAIATALMPPLCTVGYGLANLNWRFAGGAMYLFCINCVFIALATYITSKQLKYPQVAVNSERYNRQTITTILVILLLFIPSIISGYYIIIENNFSKEASRFVKENRAIGKTYIYDYTINTNEKPYTIDLRLAGESMTDDVKELVYREAESHGLMRSQIIFHEDATVELGKLNENEMVRDMIASKDLLLQQLNDSVRYLQTELTEYQSLPKSSAQIANEIRQQWTEVGEVTIAQGMLSTQANNKSSEEIVVLIQTKTNLSKEEVTRMTNWLKVRLQHPSIRVVQR